MRTPLLTLSLLLLPITVLASGYGVFTQGAAGLGQANAVVAHATGPSSAYFNPALLTEVTGTQVEIGTTGVYAKRKVKLDTPPGGTQHGEDNWDFPSTFYLTRQVNERVTAGLAVFFPFGLSNEWKDDFAGRYIGTYGEIITTSINPCVAVKVSDRLSLAAGVSAVYFDAELKSMINQSAAGIVIPISLSLPPIIDPTLADIEQTFTGDDWGFGYNFGLTAQLTDALSFGATYRSEIDLRAEGDLKLAGVDPRLAPFFPESKGSADITLPQQLAAALAYRFADSFVAEAGVRWEDWESTDELKIELKNGQPTAPIPRDWHATWTYNVGGQYRASEALALNAGYLYGKNAVPDRTVEVLIPDSDAHLFTLGAEWTSGPWTLAGALGYEHHEGRSKHNDIGDPLGSLLAGTPVNTANGDYEVDIYLLALSLGYKF